MTPGNTDLVRPIYEEWGRGNWRPRFDVYDQHMEWGWSDEFPGLGGVYEDHEDPNPRLRAWLNGWEDWRAEADDFLEIGRSEEHTSELQSRQYLVCRLLLEK